jgi:muramoyltetrapeptide carboxypeptidase
MEIIRPQALKTGSTIGVFTPSSPAYVWNEGLFVNGLDTLKRLGFKIKIGELTARRNSQQEGAARDRLFMPKTR